MESLIQGDQSERLLEDISTMLLVRSLFRAEKDAPERRGADKQANVCIVGEKKRDSSSLNSELPR